MSVSHDCQSCISNKVQDRKLEADPMKKRSQPKKFIKGIEHVPCKAVKHKSPNCTGWTENNGRNPQWCKTCTTEYMVEYRKRHPKKFANSYGDYKKQSKIDEELNPVGIPKNNYQGLNDMQIEAMKTGNVELLLKAPTRPNPYDE